VDDKSINLWRQIEDCRRNNKGSQEAKRAKDGGPPAREAAAS
jgi:hypothetical protein